MALPANDLDRYASYTYHFELYASSVHDDLLQYEFTDMSQVGTTRTAPNGNMLINTRRDAFQSIEDVHYYITSPIAGLGYHSGGGGSVQMTIRESNGFGFVDKMQNMLILNQTSDLTSMHFALKTVFVGRLPDNTIEQSNDLPLLLMILTNFEMVFTNEGAVFTLHFTPNVGFDSVSIDKGININNNIAQSLGTLPKSISFNGRTVKEAMTNCEASLNGMYDSYYKENGVDKQSRPIKYQIVLAPEITGKLDSLNKDYFGPNAPAKFSYEPEMNISAMIHDVLSHSPDLSTVIVGLDDSTGNQGSVSSTSSTAQAARKIPWVRSSVQFTKTEALITYEVRLYSNLAYQSSQGSGNISQYVFDYYFSDPGKNVDVLAMELKVGYGGLYQAITRGANTMFDKSTNASGTLVKSDPKFFVNNVVTPNTTIPGMIKSGDLGSASFHGLQMDIAPMPFPSVKEVQGYATIPASQVASARLASNAIIDGYVGYGTAALTLHIRGHYNILKMQGSYPDANVNMDLLSKGCFMKVNIHNQIIDPINNTVNKQPFFYTGWYRVITIENSFIGGLFTQTISMLADSSMNKAPQPDVVAVALPNGQSLGPLTNSAGTLYNAANSAASAVSGAVNSAKSAVTGAVSGAVQGAKTAIQSVVK